MSLVTLGLLFVLLQLNTDLFIFTSGLYKCDRKQGEGEGQNRDLTLLSHSRQLLIVPWSLGFLSCTCGVVGVVGKFARVLLSLISGATMKAVICASPFLLGQTMARPNVAQWLFSQSSGELTFCPGELQSSGL